MVYLRAFTPVFLLLACTCRTFVLFIYQLSLTHDALRADNDLANILRCHAYFSSSYWEGAYSPRCKHVMEERQRGMRHFLPTITMPKTSLYLKVNYFCQFRFLFSNVIHSFCDFFHVTKHKKTILHFFKHEFQPPIRFAHLNSGYTFFFCSRFSLKTAKLFDFSVESDN